MTLEAASYIANIIVGASVIASLVFVGLQLRHSAAAARASTYQSLIQNLRTVQMVLVTDRSILESMMAADIHPDRLHGVERAHMRMCHHQLLSALADFHRQSSGGFLPPGVWPQMRAGVVAPLSSPFVRQEWPWLRERIDEGFIAWAENEVPALTTAGPG